MEVFDLSYRDAVVATVMFLSVYCVEGDPVTPSGKDPDREEALKLALELAAEVTE